MRVRYGTPQVVTASVYHKDKCMYYRSTEQYQSESKYRGRAVGE